MRPATHVTAIAVALGSLVLAACAARTVSSYAERGVDFTQYRTYAWAPADRFATGDPRLDNNPFFQERVRAAVEGQLQARGFEKSASGAPDLILHHHASIAQRIDVGFTDRPYGGGCDDCAPDVYDAGTLVIDFVDARRDRLVWRGWAEGSVHGVIEDQAWMEQRIDEAVARILARLPGRL